MHSPISFGATLVDKVKIKDNRYLIPINRKVSLVEFDINNAKDMFTLEDVAEDWEEKNNGSKMFASDLYRSAERYQIKQPENVERSHFYAITTQKDNFEKISPDTVLCISQFDETKNEFNSLEYLQARPDSIYDKRQKRKYSELGTSMVRFLQRNTNKSIEVDGLGAQDFYTKMGFVHLNERVHTSRMVWII